VKLIESDRFLGDLVVVEEYIKNNYNLSAFGNAEIRL